MSERKVHWKRGSTRDQVGRISPALLALFFAFSKPGVFDIQELHVVSDANVAFCFAAMRCADRSSTPDFVDLDFRLTVGPEKVDGRWTVVHEHHSIPSE